MKKNSTLIILGILVGLNLLAWLAVYSLNQPQLLEVTFFDVGQGDAIFIETPNQYQVLIDGGPDDTILEKLGEEMPFWDRTIDLVVLTHPEHDHIAGLIEVLKRYKVEDVLWTGVVRDTGEYKEWVRALGEEGANIYIAQSSQCATRGVAQLCVLYPFESLQGREAKNSNDTSIVAKLTFGKTSFLFTGDASKSVEKKLSNIDADVLKVGHHGSKTSTAQEFVRAVSPEIAVISAGKDNKYGHPHQKVLDNLAGIKIFRTDLDGDIKITSDGIKYYLK